MPRKKKKSIIKILHESWEGLSFVNYQAVPSNLASAVGKYLHAQERGYKANSIIIIKIILIGLGVGGVRGVGGAGGWFD